jgi:signal transduction histidine kinase
MISCRVFFLTERISNRSINVGTFTMAVCFAAFVMLWIRRYSVLDQWLLVVAVAAISEIVLAVALVTGRWSLGFYAGRAFSLATSTIVLIALLTETIQNQARLARANFMLQRERQNKLMNIEAVVASLSHELRQPLGALAINAETSLLVLAAGSPDLGELRSIAREINQDSLRSSEILHGFRRLFGKDEARRNPVNLNAVVEDALRALRRDVTGQREIAWRIELTPDLPIVMGDAAQLHEVVINLVQNAIEALANVESSDRQLRISTASLGNDKIVLTVEDTGSGIDPRNVAAIFDAFVTTKPRGMGLGLAICRMIVERHEGRISIEPVRPHGSLFRVILPASSTNSPPGTKQLSTTAKSNRRQVDAHRGGRP